MQETFRRFVRTVNRFGRYAEGGGGFGLSLMVKERKDGGLAKSWSQRLRINGKPSNVGLRRYPIVTLAEARTKPLENARAVKRDATRAIVRGYLRSQVVEKVMSRHGGRRRRLIGEGLAFVFGAVRVPQARPQAGKRDHDCRGARGDRAYMAHQTATARRVKGRISSIMRRAIAQNYIENNPASDAVAAALPTGQMLSTLLP